MAIVWDALVPPAEQTAFARAVPMDQQYVLNQIFPDRVDLTLEARFGEIQVTARTAKARAFDAPPAPGRRDSFQTSSVQLPAISQFLNRGESDRLRLERLRQSGQSNAALVEAIYDDTQTNVLAVLHRAEVMRGDLFTDGKVTLPELDNLEADFGVPGTHFVTAGVPWTDHVNSDPVGDMRGWGQVYRRSNGFSFGGMVLSENTLYDLLQNAKVRLLVFGALASNPQVVTVEQLNAVLAAHRLPPIRLVYDAQVVDDADQPVNILDPTKVHFTPPAGLELGYTQWGMTATGLELRDGGVVVEPSPAGIVAIVDKQVQMPYRETAYVDATCMPVLSRPRGLFVAKVAA